MHSHDAGVAPQPHETAHSALKRENARLQLLLNLTHHITSNLELQDLLRAISANIREVMQCEAVAIYLADSTAGSFIVHALDYPQGKGLFKEGLRLTPPVNDPLKRAFDTLKPVIVNTDDRGDIHPEGYKITIGEGFKSHFFIPLTSHGRGLGVLAVG
ncbi:MAG: GAF domain-containing protein, partial [Pyrinomonadaceae bacterium]